MDITQDNYYEKLGSAGKQGTDFQIDVLTVVFLNSLRKGESFVLSTEDKSAGKFDDIVIEYAQPKAGFFIQTKHKQRKYINYKDLISDNPKSDFGLPMYFCSYQELKQTHAIQNIIICTNTGVNITEDIVKREVLCEESLLYFKGKNILFCTFNQNELFLKDLKENVKKYCANNLQGKEMDVSDASIKDFINHLQLIVHYPTRKNLNQIFKNIISEIEFTQGLDCGICTEYVHKKINTWYEQSRGTYLTLEHGKAFFSEIRSNKYCETLKSYDISFKNVEVPLKGTNERMLHIISEEEYILSTVQIYRALQSEDISKALFINKDEKTDFQMLIVDCFKMPYYNYLVIICTEIAEKDVIQEIIVRLASALKNINKKVILISENSNKLAKEIKVSNFDAGIVEVKRQFSFFDLTEFTQNDFKETRNIIFQDECISLKELLPALTDEELNDFVNTDMLLKFATNHKIKVGNKVNTLEEGIRQFYIQRSFNRYNKSVSEMKMGQYDVTNNENLILISDSPGMGKSTVLTSMATAIKKNSPNFWVIRINISSYTDILLKLKKNNSKSVMIEEILDSQKTTRMTTFEKKVFSLQNKVMLMIDGVDEVSPEYKDIILKLIEDCKKKSNFAKIYITTRPHLREELESKLQVTSWTLQPLSKKNQVDFLKNYWVANLNVTDSKKKEKCEMYANSLITETSWQIWCFFAGVPLQTRMFAEVFQEMEHDHDHLKHWQTCAEFLTSDNEKPDLPKKLDLAELYEMFVSKKFDIFVDYYKHSLSNYGRIYEECKQYHHTLALETVLNKEECNVFDCYRRKGRRNLNEKFPIKLGVIQKIDDKPCFMHRTFAEYFVAECLMGQLESDIESEQFDNFLINEVLLYRMQFCHVTCTFLNSILLKKIDLIPNEVCKNIGIKLSSKLGSLVLYESASRGFMGLLRLLFKCVYFTEVDVDIDSIDDDIFDDNELYATAEEDGLAVEKFYDLYTTKYLVANNIDVNSRTEYARSVLHGAALSGHLDVIIYMVESGADINSRNEYGRTALHESAFGGHLDVVKYLLENGLDIDGRAEYSHTALHQAVLGGHLNVIKYLVEKGANVNCVTENNHTALFEAVSVNIFDYPVEDHADSDSDNSSYCETPSKVYLDIVKYLVENGVDVNSRAENDRTALHEAASNGYLDMAKCLVENGAGINSATDQGHSVLYEAVSRNHLDVVQYLIESCADIESKTKDGCTALHIAASKGHLSIVEWLIEHNANINSRCDRGATALHEAVNVYGSLHVVKYLVKKGLDVNSRTVESRTALHEAASIGQFEIAKYLINSGADITCRDGNDCTALYLAALNNHLDIVKFLVQNGADVNGKTNDHTPLYDAASQGHLDVVKHLVENGADLNSKTGEGFTALHEAIFSGHLDLVKYLMENKADVTGRAASGFSAFHMAVAGGHLNMIKYLVQNGSDINSEVGDRKALDIAAFSGHLEVVKYLVENGANVESKNIDDRTALHEAATNGYLEIVTYLMQKGIDINGTTKDDRTALHEAASNGHMDIVKFLVENGADIDRKTKNDWTTLYEAAAAGYLDIVKYLVENGAHLDSKTEFHRTAFHVAIKGGHLDVVKFFIENGTEVGSKVKNDHTALYEAVSESRFDIVKYLVEHGADVNSKTENSRTALHEAASVGNLDIFKYLLENGADIEVRTKYNGCTVFHLAAMGGHLDIVKYLLEIGIDVDCKTAYDNTALHEATVRGRVNMVKYLVKNGANVNSRVNYGGTALFMGASSGNLEIVQCLVENGVDVNSRTDDRTPLGWAASRGYLDVVKYLVENGADLGSTDESGHSVCDVAATGGHLEVVKYLVEKGAAVADSIADTSVHCSS